MADYSGLVARARKISKRLHPSRKWQPMQMIEETDGSYTWINELYEARVVKFGTASGPMLRIGICNRDGSARHDWRDFQKIKNQIAGDEWEAVELYPAESRLIDPSNFYYLWCFQSLPYGIRSERRIAGPDDCIAPQRGWAAGDEPEHCGVLAID